MSVPNLETTTWTYTNRGQVDTQTRSVNMSSPSNPSPVFSNFSTVYAYDNADRLLTTKYPNNEVVTSAYDEASQLVSINGWQILSGVTAYASGATYSPLGQLTKLNLANGLNTQYRYWGVNYNVGSNTAYGRLRGICVSTLTAIPCGDDNADSGKPGFSNAANVRLNLAYAYDTANTNIFKIGDRTRDQGQKFIYDELDRLTNACTTTSAATDTCFTSTDTSTYDESYVYSAIGNLTSKGGVNLGYTDTAHKHAVTTWNGVVRYQYDLAGNMTSRVDGSTFAQEWNEDNRLTKVTVNGLVTQFFYDADGTLIKEFGSDQKITVTVGSHYEWDNATNAGKTRSFYFFNGQRIAVRERDVATPNNDAITFYHPDHLGSINAVTGSGGSNLAQMRYKPWGEKRWSNSESLLGNKRFNGNNFEEGLKLYYYGARWYYPTVGRFLSADVLVPDPSNPQDLNRYSYARNNAIGFTDPTGHCVGVLGGADTAVCAIGAAAGPPGWILVGGLLVVGGIVCAATESCRTAVADFFQGGPAVQAVPQTDTSTDATTDTAPAPLPEMESTPAPFAPGNPNDETNPYRLATGENWGEGTSTKDAQGIRLTNSARAQGDALGGRAFGTTVAATEYKGKTYYSVYSRYSNAIDDVQAATGSGFVSSNKRSDHAEVTLFNKFSGMPGWNGKIGISNPRGPCPDCRRSMVVNKKAQVYFNVKPTLRVR